jgi:hypothetical protein
MLTLAVKRHHNVLDKLSEGGLKPESLREGGACRLEGDLQKTLLQITYWSS